MRNAGKFIKKKKKTTYFAPRVGATVVRVESGMSGRRRQSNSDPFATIPPAVVAKNDSERVSIIITVW